MGCDTGIAGDFSNRRPAAGALGGRKSARRVTGAAAISAQLLISACVTEPVGNRESHYSSATQAVEHFLDAEATNRSLNAYVHVDADAARRQARNVDSRNTGSQALKGWVFAVKDNIHVAGMPNAAGTDALRDFRPTESASVVRRLQSEGAVIFGKANMHELAYGVTNNNFAFGPARNPFDSTRIPGGSSGGSAVAVAAGLARAALGTDTGGSARIPAALTGVVGFRPTTGRYPNDGVTLISPTRDTIGLITRSVADAVAIDNALMDRPARDQAVALKGVRLGAPRTHFLENLDPDVETAFHAAFDALRVQGAEIIPVDVGDVAALNARVGFPVVLYETSVELPRYLERNATGVTIDQLRREIKSPDVRAVTDVAFSGAVTKADYEAAVGPLRDELIAAFRRCFEQYRIDALVFPTTPITARKIDGILDGVKVRGEVRDAFATYIQNTDPGSNAGLPGISLPIGFDRDGLPIGLELDARPGDDDRLLMIALAVEKALASNVASTAPTARRENSRSKDTSEHF